MVGGGIAGLAAARALSGSFERVTLYDRDVGYGSSDARQGAPQGRHLHVLLARGQRAANALFPGIDADFTAAGCPRFDWAKDVLWETTEGAFPRYASDVACISMSRPFLESAMLARVRKLANVRIESARAERLWTEGGRARGVYLEGSGAPVEADLVAIAGGQSFPLARFIGAERIAEETDQIDIVYRSIRVDARSLRMRGFRQYYYQFDPSAHRVGAVVTPVENGMAMCTIAHARNESVGARFDIQDFMEFARTIPGGKFGEAVAGARAADDAPSTFSKRFGRVLRFEKLSPYPSGVIALGDSVCSFNPVFGQGMTVALAQAQALRDWNFSERKSAERFQKRAAQEFKIPLRLSRGGSQSDNGFATRYLRNYMDECRASQARHAKFFRTLHLEGRPFDLLSPRAFVRTLRGEGSRDRDAFVAGPATTAAPSGLRERERPFQDAAPL